VGYPNIPRRHPVKPTLRPGAVKHLHRIGRLSQMSIDGAQDHSDLMVPALELMAGLHPVGRAGLLARDVWGYFGPQQPEQPGGEVLTPGWVTCCDTGGPFDTEVYSGPGFELAYCTTAELNNCGAGLQALTPRPGPGSRLIRALQTSVSPARYTIVSRHKRVVQTAEPWAFTELPPIPGVRTVQPVPATVTPPRPTVVESMPQPRETARPEPLVPGFIKPLPVNPMRPGADFNPHKPALVPANTVIPAPGGVIVPPQEPHVQAPYPGKELKIKVHKMSPAMRAIADIYNNATEYDDMMDIVADSIDKNPCKGLRGVKRDWCIANNFEDIDIDSLMEGLIYNYFEDKLVGTFLSWGKKSPYGVHLPTTGHRRNVNPSPIVHNSHYIRP